MLSKGKKLVNKKLLPRTKKALNTAKNVAKKGWNKAKKVFGNKPPKKPKRSKVFRNIAQYGEDFGKMGKYVKNPHINVDWSTYAKHASKRMQQRGMNNKAIDKIVKNGKTLSQNNGNKFAFVTKDGVAVVSKEGKLITAWGKENFDDNMKQIVRRLYGGK